MTIIDIIKTGVNTLYFNLKVFGIGEGIKLKAIIGPNVKFGQLHKNSIIIHNRLRLGVGNGSFHNGKNLQSFLNIEKGSLLEIEGSATMESGFVLNITEKSKIKIGDNFWANYGCIISIANGLSIEKNVLLGWNVTIIDSDGHSIKSTDNNKKINEARPIHLGENCWLSAQCSIMKGVTLSKGTIIPYGNIITKSNSKSYTIWGGQPNHILKQDVYRNDE